MQPRIQATLLAPPLRLLHPPLHNIWHQHLRQCRSLPRPACIHRTTGLHPRRFRHPSTLHKCQCTLHRHHHHSSSSSTWHIMAFRSCHRNPSRNRRLRQHQRLLSTASTHHRRYLPILPFNTRAERAMCSRQCCYKFSVSHKSKLASFHLRRGMLSSHSQVDLV